MTTISFSIDLLWMARPLESSSAGAFLSSEERPALYMASNRIALAASNSVGGD